MTIFQIIFSVITLTLFTQLEPKESKTGNISWNKMVHNFDTINQGDQVSTNFVCVNHSDTIFVIENIQWSCGCMVAKWKHEAILPGDSTIINVTFDSQGKRGKHQKVFAVYSNQGLFELFINTYIRQTK